MWTSSSSSSTTASTFTATSSFPYAAALRLPRPWKKSGRILASPSSIPPTSPEIRRLFRPFHRLSVSSSAHDAAAYDLQLHPFPSGVLRPPFSEIRRPPPSPPRPTMLLPPICTSTPPPIGVLPFFSRSVSPPPRRPPPVVGRRHLVVGRGHGQAVEEGPSELARGWWSGTRR